VQERLGDRLGNTSRLCDTCKRRHAAAVTYRTALRTRQD